MTWAWKFQEFVIQVFIWFLISQNTLHWPWCSCSPHIYVPDMVKQETSSEAESRQLLITAAATGGSIWKCVTSSNHWVQSYMWGGSASFRQHRAWESFSPCQKRRQSVKSLSARVEKWFSNVHLHRGWQECKRAASSSCTRMPAAASGNGKSQCQQKIKLVKTFYLKIWNCHTTGEEAGTSLQCVYQPWEKKVTGPLWTMVRCARTGHSMCP